MGNKTVGQQITCNTSKCHSRHRSVRMNAWQFQKLLRVFKYLPATSENAQQLLKFCPSAADVMHTTTITTTVTTQHKWDIATMQDGRVVGKERLVLNADEVVIITSLPDTSSYERHVISAPPVVTSLHWWIRSPRENVNIFIIICTAAAAASL